MNQYMFEFVDENGCSFLQGFKTFNLGIAETAATEFQRIRNLVKKGKYVFFI